MTYQKKRSEFPHDVSKIPAQPNRLGESTELMEPTRSTARVLKSAYDRYQSVYLVTHPKFIWF